MNNRNERESTYRNNGSSIVLYTTEDDNTQLEVKLENDIVWLAQSQMAQLFGRDRTVVAAIYETYLKRVN